MSRWDGIKQDEKTDRPMMPEQTGASGEPVQRRYFQPPQPDTQRHLPGKKAAVRIAHRLGKRAVRIISTVLVLVLLFTFGPELSRFFRSLFPEARYEQTTTLLTHEMKQVGEMTFVKYTDTAVLSTKTDALFIGTVQSMTVPYRYEIGLGFSLTDVVLTADEKGITAYLPEIRMTYDTFEVTDAPEVRDFWYSLSEKRYQKMLDDEAMKCREAYLSEPEVLAQAWQTACEKLEELFGQWSGKKLPLFFKTLSEYQPVSETAHH